MKELTPVQKSAIATLAERIRELDRAVDKLQSANAQYRQLAALDYAPRRNGHLKTKEDTE